MVGGQAQRQAPTHREPADHDAVGLVGEGQEGALDLAVPLLKHVVAAMPAIGNDIKKPGVTENAYPKTPLKPLHSMVRAWKQVREDLPKVTAPLLLFRSADDHVVDPSSGRIIMDNVSSRDATERVLTNSYHVATLDNDAPQIFEESADFIRRVTTH
jgi:carboxylesterase